MSEINFLSEAFVRELGRRQRLYREMVMVGIVALTLGAWGLTSWRQLAGLRSALVDRQAAADQLGVQTQQIATMNQQHEALKHQVRVQQELTLPLEYTSVIATIGQLMPESLAITELSIVSTMPKPMLKADKLRAADPNATAAAPPPRDPQVMRINVAGLSPTDGDVADFVEKVTAHPIFGSVKMHYTRPKRILNVAAREFRVEMEISLDRQYLPADEKAQASQEVPDAG